jgi:hypothetical protein
MWRTAWERCVHDGSMRFGLTLMPLVNHIANTNNISLRAWGPVTDSEVLGTHPSPTGEQVSFG